MELDVIILIEITWGQKNNNWCLFLCGRYKVVNIGNKILEVTGDSQGKHNK